MNHYLPLTEEDRRLMLKRIGVKDFEELLKDIPEDLRLKAPLNLPGPLSELEIERELTNLSKENETNFVSFIGAGAYDHFIPSAVFTIAQRSEFVTSYTPYQAEVSQGTLQVMYEYQSLIARLTQMEVANSSMYDGASALAEAALMALRVQKNRNTIIYPESLHPLWEKVLLNYLHGRKTPTQKVRINRTTGAIDMNDLEEKVDQDTAAVILAHPNFYGILEAPSEVGEIAHRKEALFIMAFDPISLGILAPPGAFDADIAVAEGQSLGIPISFGGPYLGVFTTKKEFIRKMPGRIAGKTTDTEGKRGFVMALQTREQHIRRERATSNICTNQNLCALFAASYLSLMGKWGIRKVAELSLQKAHYLAHLITQIPGVTLAYSGPFFKEFTVTLPVSAEFIFNEMEKKGFFAGVPLSWFAGNNKEIIIAVTEKIAKESLDSFASNLREVIAYGSSY